MQVELFDRHGKPAGSTTLPDDILEAAVRVQRWMQSAGCCDLGGLTLRDPGAFDTFISRSLNELIKRKDASYEQVSGELTRAHKLAEVARELEMRRMVYPRLVSSGKMTQSESDSRINTMKAIMEDYARV